MRGLVARERTVERLERRSVRHAQHVGGHVSERDVGDFERLLHKVAFGGPFVSVSCHVLLDSSIAPRIMVLPPLLQ